MGLESIFLTQASISSIGGQFVAFICKGRGTSRSSYEDSDSLSSMVTERNSRTLGDDSVAYVVPDDATTDILSSI